LTPGDQALADALAFQKTGSKWLFQISLVDRFAAEQSGSPLSRKRTLPLYESLLRDPTGADWSADPLEALSVLAIPHPSAYERWFEIARQQSPELGLEVADRARRHRFLSTLPLGGRLMALRWVLEAPLERLGPESRMQRQELFLRYPRYAEFAKQAHQVRDGLAAKPLAAVGAEAQRVQADKLAELGRLSAEQEALLHEMALRRESASIDFPPIRKTKEAQAALTPRQLLFVFFATHDNTYAWLLSKNRLAAWKIEAPPALLEKTVSNLLRAIGNIDANHELTRTELADDAWRGSSRDAFEALVAGSKVNLAANIDEIAIVPDGVLWYLPFEALEVAKGNQAKETVPLLTKSRIRYLPTMGLAVPDRQERRPLGAVGVALGKLHPHDDAQIAETEFERLTKLTPSVSPIRRSLPAPVPLYGSLFDTLVVLDDLSMNVKAAAGSDRLPYDWTPIQLDRARGAAPMSQWFPLPWKNSIVLLPGFHTPAENALHQPGAGPLGSDLFLSTCGLMSTGARTVLISRWRTGGQSSYDLVHQFAQELPYTSAADAWQRAVETVRETPLDADREPRVKRPDRDEPAMARHPLFWSGYMVVDTGWAPPAGADGLAAKK
jgi:CHAT domain-containing protein